MTLIVRNEPWPRFMIKVILVLLLLISIGYAFTYRYRIGVDRQVIKCIPGYSVYLIDRLDTDPFTGGIFMFSSKGLEPIYADGTNLVKFMRAGPGDKVSVDANGMILINDAFVGGGLVHAERLGKQPQDFVGQKVLSEHEYWMLGSSGNSFDSRYWGTISDEQITGRAYPLF